MDFSAGGKPNTAAKKVVSSTTQYVNHNSSNYQSSIAEKVSKEIVETPTTISSNDYDTPSSSHIGETHHSTTITTSNDQTSQKNGSNRTHTNTSQHNKQNSNKVHYSDILQTYYNYSDTYFFSLIDCNYTYGTANQHILSAGIFLMRFKMFGIAPLNFELCVVPESKIIDYKPIAKIYFPLWKQFSINLYGGCSVDATGLWSQIWESNDYSTLNEYGCSIVGISFAYNALRFIPFEIFGEYRMLWTGELHDQGFYIGA